MSVLTCGQCETMSKHVDKFKDLQLSFPSNCVAPSVQTLLDNLLQPENLSGDNKYHCDHCGKLTDSERRVKISEPPKKLILTVMCFRYDANEQSRLKILQTLTLNESIFLDEYLYELHAVVVHLGHSVDSGHYYTFAKDKDDWFKFNDDFVTRTTWEDLVRLEPPEMPYLLFYSREKESSLENLALEELGASVRSRLRNEIEKTPPIIRTNPEYKQMYNVISNEVSSQQDMEYKIMSKKVSTKQERDYKIMYNEVSSQQDMNIYRVQQDEYKPLSLNEFYDNSNDNNSDDNNNSNNIDNNNLESGYYEDYMDIDPNMPALEDSPFAHLDFNPAREEDTFARLGFR